MRILMTALCQDITKTKREVLSLLVWSKPTMLLGSCMIACNISSLNPIPWLVRADLSVWHLRYIGNELSLCRVLLRQ